MRITTAVLLLAWTAAAPPLRAATLTLSLARDDSVCSTGSSADGGGFESNACSGMVSGSAQWVADWSTSFEDAEPITQPGPGATSASFEVDAHAGATYFAISPESPFDFARWVHADLAFSVRVEVDVDSEGHAWTLDVVESLNGLLAIYDDLGQGVYGGPVSIGSPVGLSGAPTPLPGALEVCFAAVPEFALSTPVAAAASGRLLSGTGDASLEVTVGLPLHAESRWEFACNNQTVAGGVGELLLGRDRGFPFFGYPFWIRDPFLDGYELRFELEVIDAPYGPDELAIPESDDPRVLRANQQGGFLVLASGDALIEPWAAAELANGDLAVLDRGARTVLRIDRETGAQSVVSQDGLIIDAEGMTSDATGLDLFLTDPIQDTIVHVDGITGAQTLVTSGGLLAGGRDLTLGLDGQLYVANGLSANKIVRVDPTTGAQSVASDLSNGIGISVAVGIGTEADGQLIALSDFGTRRVVRVDPASGAQTILTENGFLLDPLGVDVTSDGSILVSDAGSSGRLVQVDPATGAQRFLASGLGAARRLHVKRLPEPALPLPLALGVLVLANAGGAPPRASPLREQPREPRLHRLPRRLRRRVVGVEQHDRHPALREQRRVRALDVLAAGRPPEGRGVNAGGLLDEAQPEGGRAPLDAEAYALRLAPRDPRHVQVEPRALRQQRPVAGRRDQAVDHPRGEFGGAREVLAVAGLALLAHFVGADGDRGHAAHADGGGGGADGPGDPRRGAGVGAGVRARDEQVEGIVGVGHRREAEQGAGRGGGLGAVLPLGPRLDADGAEGHRGAAAAAVVAGGDDRDPMAGGADRLGEGREADGAVAVVVGEQDVEAAGVAGGGLLGRAQVRAAEREGEDEQQGEVRGQGASEAGGEGARHQWAP